MEFGGGRETTFRLSPHAMQCLPACLPGKPNNIVHLVTHTRARAAGGPPRFIMQMRPLESARVHSIANATEYLPCFRT